MSSEAPDTKARILIVDDEQAQMTALCDTLSAHDFQISGFTSPHAALEALQHSRFDLLLSDLMMPELDGIELIERARSIDPDLVAIIMTGAGTIATAVEAMKAGALDYILKPFKLSVVLPVLSRALSVRKLRIENAELQKRIHERTLELEAANRELQMANQELEAFSYSVSHDLRTPLGQMISFADLLRYSFADQMSPEARELLSNIVAGGERMNELINDLLRLSMLSRQPLTLQRIDTASLVQEALPESRLPYEGHFAELRVSDLPNCCGDPALLRQVFVNLLSNAYKYTQRQPRPVIEVGCECRGIENVFFVRDNGAGFDMKYAEKLFGVFKRLHSDEEFKGTGVGLSIVQRIIQRHGGRIWADAAVGKGATFFFTLPFNQTDNTVAAQVPARR